MKHLRPISPCAALAALLAACTPQVRVSLPTPDLGDTEPVAGSPAPAMSEATEPPDVAADAGPPLRAEPTACPGPTVCTPAPEDLSHRPWACVDPAGYRFISELSAGACEPLEFDGQLWPQELVKGLYDRGLWGCSPVCNGGEI